ncbi:MAG: nucleotidyltransferase domain-containing protein [Phycisphaerales bacterium]
MNGKLTVDKGRIADFCRRHRISRLAIFGSALRDDFGPDSDVDVLVTFELGHVPGFSRLFDAEAWGDRAQLPRNMGKTPPELTALAQKEEEEKWLYTHHVV